MPRDNCLGVCLLADVPKCRLLWNFVKCEGLNRSLTDGVGRKGSREQGPGWTGLGLS